MNNKLITLKFTYDSITLKFTNKLITLKFANELYYDYLCDNHKYAIILLHEILNKTDIIINEIDEGDD